MKTLRLDEIEGVPVFGTLVWKPIRRPLGVTAFGINAYAAADADGVGVLLPLAAARARG